jgi:hypothetical protein
MVPHGSPLSERAQHSATHQTAQVFLESLQGVALFIEVVP